MEDLLEKIWEAKTRDVCGSPLSLVREHVGT